MISGDGKFIVFQSDANNLIANDTNSATDIFLYDRVNETTTRVSLKSDGTEADADSRNPDISEDGQYIVFESDAINIINGDTNEVTDIFLRDTAGPTTIRASVSSGSLELTAASTNPSISADNSTIAFESVDENVVANDANQVKDIFIYKRAGGTVTRASIASSKVESNGASSLPSLSADGRYVAFRLSSYESAL